jgi:hypothetical protein
LRKRVKFVVSNPTRRVDDLICLVKLNTVIPVPAIEHAPSQLDIERELASKSGLTPEPRRARKAAAERGFHAVAILAKEHIGKVTA